MGMSDKQTLKIQNKQNCSVLHPPIVIGGVGGSGTRVIAEMCNILGVNIGWDLNQSLDNLSYTLIFKRPGWFMKNHENKGMIFRGLRILRDQLQHGKIENFSDHVFLFKAMLSLFLQGHNYKKDGRGLWAIKRWINFYMKSGMAEGDLWGWKEPNSHLLLPFLNEYFPGLKYIHCIRNGLDMAFSQNQQQLMNWGSLFGVNVPNDQGFIPSSSFRFWKIANQKVLDFGNAMPSNHFLVVNFEHLYQNPHAESGRLAKFIGVDPTPDILERLSSVPQTPKSAGRYRNQDISWLTEDDIHFLRENDFSCPGL